jgi:hypothetical protein
MLAYCGRLNAAVAPFPAATQVYTHSKDGRLLVKEDNIKQYVVTSNPITWATVV